MASWQAPPGSVAQGRARTLRYPRCRQLARRRAPLVYHQGRLVYWQAILERKAHQSACAWSFGVGSAVYSNARRYKE